MNRAQIILAMLLTAISNFAQTPEAKSVLPSTPDAAISAATPARPTMADRSPRYKLQASDVLNVTFRFSPEFNQEVTIEPDGFISLQVTGELKVQGMTIGEATQAIASKAALILKDPVVNISLKDFAPSVIYVGGNVVKPGRLDLRGRMSVTDAIASAGGMIPGSKDTDVVLFRRVSNDMVEVKRIDMKRAIEKDALMEDVVLQPNDSIYVSKSKIGKLERFMQVSHLGLYFPIPY
jgi:polysaccharide export outer membrane protein